MVDAELKAVVAQTRWHIMINSVENIYYSGTSDIAIYEEDLSLTLLKEWFFSKDKNCYGIPLKIKCTGTNGDAFFDIKLKNSNNDLAIGMSIDYCQTYTAVMWIDHDIMYNPIALDISEKKTRKSFFDGLL